MSKPINEPVDLNDDQEYLGPHRKGLWQARFREVGGYSRPVWLNRDQVIKFNADPDKFVAERLGATVNEYYEWLRLDGRPYCSGRTKSRRRCRISGPMQQPFSEWKRTHRSRPCHLHGGAR